MYTLFFLMACQPWVLDSSQSYYYDTAWAWPRNQWDGPPGTESNQVFKGNIELQLRTGYLTSSGIFNEHENSLYLDPNGDYKFIQVAAEPSRYSQYDLDLVRIRYTSDRTEWLWGEPSETYVFLTEEECQQYGFYCDEVVAGEGDSGFFEAENGDLVSGMNTHCTHVGLPYTYTVTAYAYDFSSYENVRISDDFKIDINCRSY